MTDEPQNPMIEIRDLEFDYGDGGFRLRIPCLDVAGGAHTAVIGPSGCGKTTLLNLIAGIVVPRAGSIRLAGEEITALPDFRRRDYRIANIGLVFQEFELLEYLDVLDNILLPYRINTSLTLDAAVRERARELADAVGIGDWLHRYPSALSQGERQRVAVCRALLPAPDLLLADEPTGNLDPTNKGRVLDILLEQASAAGATLFAATHDYDLLPRFDAVFDFKELQPRNDDAGVAATRSDFAADEPRGGESFANEPPTADATPRSDVTVRKLRVKGVEEADKNVADKPSDGPGGGP